MLVQRKCEAVDDTVLSDAAVIFRSGLRLPPSLYLAKQVRCRKDDDCEQSMFCDTHYGFCDNQRTKDEPCRLDRHCNDRLLCMFGKCQVAPKPGHKGEPLIGVHFVRCCSSVPKTSVYTRNTQNIEKIIKWLLPVFAANI